MKRPSKLVRPLLVLIGGGVVLSILGSSSSASASDASFKPPATGSGGLLLLLDRSDRARPLPSHFKGRSNPRDPSNVDTILVHNTAARGGFGLTSAQIKAAGGDPIQALLNRYEKTPYHAVFSPREGRQLSVFQWPVDAYSYHGHGGNSRSIGWSYDGDGSEVNVPLAREAFAHAVNVARQQGAPLRFVEAHYQHSDERGDPGPKIWREVVLPMLEPLGLVLSDRVTGSGRSIPKSWS